MTVTIGLASMPDREVLLRQTVASLLTQADRVCVYLNGYEEIPDFLSHPQIRVATSQDFGDRGDAGKFFWCDRLVEGYYLTCDDDLLYMPGYVDAIIHGIERYDRQAVVGLHGAILAINARSPYERMLNPCLAHSYGDFFVNVLGTGVMGYHTSTWEISPAVFRSPNMADIWLAVIAQELGQPLVCIRHGQDWVIDLDPQNTIFDNSVQQTGTPLDTFDRQCEVVASIDWKLHRLDGVRL